MEPTLAQLRYFVAVAEERSFTRAAARVHLSQQALSSSIAALETLMGVSLVVRTTRRVELTESGEALLDEARALLAQATRSWARVRAAGGSAAASVRIGVSPAVAPDEAASVVARLARASGVPGIGAHAGALDDLVERLRDGDLDLVLARYPVPGDGLAARQIGWQPLRLAVGPAHPLHDADRAALADVARDPVLAWGAPDRSPFSRRVDQLCRRAGFAPRFVRSPSSGAAALLSVAQDEAVALIAAGHPTPAGVRLLELTDDDARVPLHALWPATRPPALLEHLEDAGTATA